MKTVEERILNRKDLFVHMWNTDQRSESIAALFMISTTTVNAWGKKLGLRRRYLGAQCKPFLEGEPSKAEIRFARIAIHERKCAIQRAWDAETEYLRRVQRPAEYSVNRLSWTANGFVDAGPAESHPMINTDMMNKLIKESGHARKSHSGFVNERARKAS